MDEKETLLTIIKENGWVTPVRHFDLLLDLQEHYQINNVVSEALLRECLSEGLITVNRDRYAISRRGQQYLQDIAGNNYVNIAYQVANARPRVDKKKIGFWSGVEKSNLIISIITSVLTIALAIIALKSC